MEKDTGKELDWEPYEPHPGERLALGGELRRHVAEAIGGDTISRFIKGEGRITQRLPYGTDILEFAEFETLGTTGGVHWLRATVEIHFEGAANAAYWNDPFRQTVEFPFVPPAPPEPVRKPRYVREESGEVPYRPREYPAEATRAINSARWTTRQVAAIVLAGAALAAGAALMHHGDRVRDWLKDATKESWPEKFPGSLPQTPEPWLKY